MSGTMTNYHARYIGWKVTAILFGILALILMIQLGTGAGDPVRDIMSVKEICKNGQVIADIESGQPVYYCQLLVTAD